MKSQFFTDTQGLDTAPDLSGKVHVCLLMDRDACERLFQQASRLGLTTGEYMDQLVLSAPFSACGTKAPPKPCNPWPCFPPAPPDH